MIEWDTVSYENDRELLVCEEDLCRIAGYLPEVCGRDLTVSCVPASCRRSPGHPGECSVLTDDELSSIDGEAKAMLGRIFPNGLFSVGSF